MPFELLVIKNSHVLRCFADELLGSTLRAFVLYVILYCRIINFFRHLELVEYSFLK